MSDYYDDVEEEELDRYGRISTLEEIIFPPTQATESTLEGINELIQIASDYSTTEDTRYLIHDMRYDNDKNNNIMNDMFVDKIEDRLNVWANGDYEGDVSDVCNFDPRHLFDKDSGLMVSTVIHEEDPERCVFLLPSFAKKIGCSNFDMDEKEKKKHQRSQVTMMKKKFEYIQNSVNNKILTKHMPEAMKRLKDVDRLRKDKRRLEKQVHEKGFQLGEVQSALTTTTMQRDHFEQKVEILKSEIKFLKEKLKQQEDVKYQHQELMGEHQELKRGYEELQTGNTELRRDNVTLQQTVDQLNGQIQKFNISSEATTRRGNAGSVPSQPIRVPSSFDPSGLLPFDVDDSLFYYPDQKKKSSDHDRMGP